MPTKKEKNSTSDTPGPMIFDVAKPGSQTASSATSRPVIVSNRPIMHDPMVTTSSIDIPQEEPASPIATKIVLKPLSGSQDSLSEKETAMDGIIPVPATTAPKQDAVLPAEKPASPSSKKSVDEPAEPEPDAETGSDVLDMDKTQLQKETAALEAEAKRKEELDKIVEEKTYFLPINSVEKRRSKQVFAVGVIVSILLGLLWLNLALDSGIITIDGLKPLTDIF